MKLSDPRRLTPAEQAAIEARPLKVMPPGLWAGIPHRWWAVADGEAIIALFKSGDDANRFAGR